MSSAGVQFSLLDDDWLQIAPASCTERFEGLPRAGRADWAESMDNC
jgi:hypothetical protein